MSQKDLFNQQTIYSLNDSEIAGDINRRLKLLRISCLVSQEELAKRSGVSIATIKRIESKKPHDTSIVTIARILRVLSELENVVNLVPEVPISPSLLDGKGIKSKKIAPPLPETISLEDLKNSSSLLSPLAGQ